MLNISADRVEIVGVDTQLLRRVQSLESWYSKEFERRLSELAEILNTELQNRTEAAQQFYEGRLAREKAQSVNGASSGSTESLRDEITKAEGEMASCTAELERMVADDSVALGRLLQARTKELELKAYLRGLKFLSASVVSVSKPD